MAMTVIRMTLKMLRRMKSLNPQSTAAFHPEIMPQDKLLTGFP
jgi:hypothetical protein